MERTFALLDQMKREGLFKAYAVGGGIAAMYYLEPILTAEYLIAISLQTYRPKDRERLVKFLEEVRINGLELGKILKSHGLEEKFGKFKERYREG
jgi:hypothetical protein